MIYSEQLLSKVTYIFKQKYNTEPELIFSPGRINLIGEHTDYNDGFVMPAAINRGIYMAFGKNELKTLRLFSLDFNQSVEININALKPIEISWANYILGVTSEIEKTHPLRSGFDLVFGGDIPIGAGLSSSAALESGVGLALNHLFGLNLKKIEIIKAGQEAEHHFVGVRCGIMDQFASVMGKKNHVIQLDCRSLDFEYFPSIFDDFQILLCNSKVKHALAESSYNQRRAECEKGVSILQEKFPDVNSLRDATITMLDAVRGQMSEIIYNRCSYIVEENRRVLKASQFLKNKDLKQFGALLFESHKGLSEKYEVSCEELDFLVDQVQDISSVLGSRMMGGGFGGCTINLIKRSATQDLIPELKDKYYKKYQNELEFYEVELNDGTHLINKNDYE